MSPKVSSFLKILGTNVFLSLFVALFAYLLLSVAFMIIMVPVAIFIGEASANSVTELVVSHIGYKIIYTVIFIIMMIKNNTGTTPQIPLFEERGLRT